MNSKLKRGVITVMAASAVGMPWYTVHAAGEPDATVPRAAEKAPRADPMKNADERDKAPADSQHAAADRSAAATNGAAQYVARASKLIGAEVTNPQGENLGEIKDLIVDVRNGTTHYAVLSFGGILGIGDKLFAYPVRMLRWGPGKDELILDVDRARLEKAPGFASDNWPDWSVDSYRRAVDDYFKTDNSVAGPAPQLMRASELIGTEVQDTRKDDVGEIKDVIVSLGNGKVLYVVLNLESNKAWSLDHKLMPLPMSALQLSADRKGRAVITETVANLDKRRAFDDKDWPDLNDAAYRRGMESYLAAPKGAAR